MKLSLIVALNKDYVIGKNGKIPWHYETDMKWFREKTLNNTVIMGRKTWESIGSEPLQGRTNIIVSKSLCNSENKQYIEMPCERNIHSWNLSDGHRVAFIPDLEILKLFNIIKGDVWFIGGAKIYEAAIPIVDELYITRVPDIITSGQLTFFPRYNTYEWKLRELSTRTEKQGVVLSMEIYDRIK